jgi:hypothetical protein
MEKTTECTRMGTSPVFPEKNKDVTGGMVNRTPGLKRMNQKAGTTRSAGVKVNLKTNLMMAQLRRANTRA